MATTDFSALAAPGVRALRPYQPGKPIDELEREYGVRNAVKLASNENPLGPSPLALAAIHRAAPDIWLYPDGGGFRLRAKLAERLGVAMNQITLGNGSSDVLEFAVRAFVTPGDEVMFSEHAFAVYPILAQAAGAKAVVVPAEAWGNDVDAMRAAFTERTRVIFVANPNNPAGTWLDAETLGRFVRSVPATAIVVVDEAYFEYARHLAGDAYPDATAWIAECPNLVVTRTFSKSYGLAGLRVGYAVSHPQVADLMNRVRPPFNVNSLALMAAEAALDDTAHLHTTLETNAAGMRQLCEGFGAMGLAYIPSVGNFISVALGRPAAPIYEALLRQGVIVRPVANYGMPNHLRVTVGRAHENERFLKALREAPA